MLNKQVKVGVLCAMDSEASVLLEKLENHVVEKHGGIDCHCGDFGGTPVAIIRCGIGKVFAAASTQLLIDFYHPEVILNSGIGGGLADDLSIGDIIVGERLVMHDFDLTPLGYARGCLAGAADHGRPTYFQPDKAVLDKLFQAAEKFAGEGHRLRRGCIASGDIFVSDGEKRRALNREFQADVAEMEGAAVAQVATAAGVPFVVLRAVSDLASGSAATYESFEHEIGVFSSKIAVEFCRNL